MSQFIEGVRKLLNAHDAHVGLLRALQKSGVSIEAAPAEEEQLVAALDRSQKAVNDITAWRKTVMETKPA